MKGHDGLLVRLCTLCREAGWMGSPGYCPNVDPATVERTGIPDLGPEIDPFIVAEILSAHVQGARPCPLKDRGRVSGGPVVFDRKEIVSFDGLYRILVDIAVLAYPLDDFEGDGSHSARAMHRLLLEDVFPLVSEVTPRLWSPR